MHKFIILTIAAISLPFIGNGQQIFNGSDYIYNNRVGIGKQNSSTTTLAAWLEIGKDSTNKGFIIPRVVDTANITSPVKGIVLYQIKDNSIYFRDRFGYRKLTDGTGYVKISDSTVYYYPMYSNPKGFLTLETDPIATAKTITFTAGTGISVSNATAQTIGSNPTVTIGALNTTAIWNASQIQGKPVSITAPTSGQVLQYNGSQYIPVNFSGGGTGSVNSVGLSLPSDIYTITNSPIISSGVLTGTFKNQLANLIWASPNGISGAPAFRSLTYTDLPLSGATAGTYGSDTTIPQITINGAGIITTIGQSTLISYIKNNISTPQTANFYINGRGNLSVLGISSGIDSQSHITLYKSYPTTINARFSIGLSRAESGSNTGGDFTLRRISDAGNTLDTSILIQRSTGNIGINVTNPTEKLHVGGNIIATAPVYSSGGITLLGRNNTSGRFETTPIAAPSTLTTFGTDATNGSSGIAVSLYSYNIPGNTLSANGQSISADYGGLVNVNGSTRTIQIVVNGTGTQYSDPITSGGGFSVHVTMLRVNSTTLKVVSDYGKFAVGYATLSAIDFTSPITLDLQGVSTTSSNDIIAKLGVIKLFP